MAMCLSILDPITEAVICSAEIHYSYLSRVQQLNDKRKNEKSKENVNRIFICFTF